MSSEPVTQEHFPDLVLCPSPGYDLMELEKRGFQGFDGYLVGLVNGDEFKVNFGGELNEDPANISRAIVHRGWKIYKLHSMYYISKEENSRI